ncbi:MAG: peptidoglycan-binding protein [Actinomycetia bacterium]|nr:peptidoglycan-binding protein [Actinomycetes bacterium]
MKQRRLLAVVVAIAVLSAAAGWFAGRSLKSSDEAQADVAAPDASLITVPVEATTLSSSVVTRGDVRYEGSVSIEVGSGFATSVVTKAPPERGAIVDEGEMFVEVTGRPLFVLQGELPMFRDLVPGVEGDDVRQFEVSLDRLGYDVGGIDGVYDEALEDAVSAFYTDSGYRAPGPSLEEQEQLTQAQEAVTQARNQVRSIQQSLNEASRPIAESTRLSLDQQLTFAQRAVDDLKADRDAAVVAATGIRDASVTARDEAKIASETAEARVAQAEAGTHPDTGVAPTPDELTELDDTAAAAVAVLVAAEETVVATQEALDVTPGQFERGIEDAETNLAIQIASRREALTPASTASLSASLEDANRSVVSAEERLKALQDEIGIDVPQAEIVFLPTLPRRVEQSLAERGDVVNGAVGRVSGVDLILDSSLGAGDRPLVSVGDRVVADDDDLGITLEGEVSFLADEQGTNGQGSNRFYMRIRLDSVDDDSDLTSNLRVTIPFDTTGGDVLAVPLAALSLRADGATLLQVERSPDEVEVIEVVTGLRARGSDLVEVRPVSAELAEGDRVVVGFEGPSLAERESDENSDRDGEEE